MITVKNPVLLSLEDVNNFFYCPGCGSPLMHVYIGDYMGSIQCMEDECELEIEFDLIDEVKSRHPKTFQKWVEEL